MAEVDPEMGDLESQMNSTFIEDNRSEALSNIIRGDACEISTLGNDYSTRYFDDESMDFVEYENDNTESLPSTSRGLVHQSQQTSPAPAGPQSSVQNYELQPGNTQQSKITLEEVCNGRIKGLLNSFTGIINRRKFIQILNFIFPLLDRRNMIRWSPKLPSNKKLIPKDIYTNKTREYVPLVKNDSMLKGQHQPTKLGLNEE